ncbi:MAG: GerMN domain-containing protein [Bacilli bacterium]
MSKFKDFILSLFSKKKEQVKNNETQIEENNLTWNIPTSEIISSTEDKRNKNKIPRKKVILACSIIFILLLGSGITIGVIKGNLDSKYNVELKVSTEKEYRRVYLLSSDNYVVPLSLKFENKQTLQEEIIDVFESLKLDNDYSSYGLTGYIPENTNIQHLSLKDGILTIDLSKDFLELAETREKQVIESLTYTFLDFVGINELELKVNGNPLNQFPHNTIVPEKLTLDLGINESYKTAIDALTKDKVTIYYSKEIKNNEYLVPCSVYVDEKDHFVNSFYESLKTKQVISSGLKFIKTYNQVNLNVLPLISDDQVVIGLNESSIMEEGIVNKDIYELLVLSFAINNVDMKIDFQLDGESLRVNGYLDNETTQVSSIIYNSIGV